MFGQNSFIEMLPGTEGVVISACDGTHMLADAKDFFCGYIDPNFKSWALDVPGDATPATPVQVCKQVKDGTFADFFGTDPENFLLSQHQIELFCRGYSGWLRKNGYATNFLFKVRETLYVAKVRVHLDGLGVYVLPFSCGDTWVAQCHCRLVFPKK